MKSSPGVHERTPRKVAEARGQQGSQWAAIDSIAAGRRCRVPHRPRVIASCAWEPRAARAPAPGTTRTWRGPRRSRPTPAEVPASVAVRRTVAPRGVAVRPAAACTLHPEAGGGPGHPTNPRRHGHDRRSSARGSLPRPGRRTVEPAPSAPARRPVQSTGQAGAGARSSGMAGPGPPVEGASQAEPSRSCASVPHRSAGQPPLLEPGTEEPQRGRGFRGLVGDERNAEAREVGPELGAGLKGLLRQALGRDLQDA